MTALTSPAVYYNCVVPTIGKYNSFLKVAELCNMCGESWHAIKGHHPPPQFSGLGTWCPAFVCVCMCMCVCVCVWWFVKFCIWVEGLYVVVRRGNKMGGGGGGALGSFSSFYIASMLYTWFFHGKKHSGRV